MARMPPSVSQIASHLFLGNASSSLNTTVLRDNGICAIVSLLNDPNAWWSRPDYRQIIPEDRHRFVRCQDNSTMDILAILPDICDFIERQLEATVQSSASSVLVHCELGISRSPSIVIAYLMRKHRKSLESIMAVVNPQRKVKPSDNFMDQLKIWKAVGYEPWEDGGERQTPKAEYQAFLDRRASIMEAK